MEVVYFESAAAFRIWLEANHESATELWVAYYRKGTGRSGITYAEAVDQALCFGWIDGVAKRVDEVSYANRYTPRRRGRRRGRGCTPTNRPRRRSMRRRSSSFGRTSQLGSSGSASPSPIASRPRGG